MLHHIQNGDRSAFREFYHLWDERLYYYFFKKTKDPVQAQELTQQTFIKFWEYRDKLTADYSLEVQLFRKAKLLFIDWMRKQVSERKRQMAGEAFYAVSANDPQPDNIMMEKLQFALKHLSPERRNVIELLYLQGYNYKEIATRLNIPVKKVDNHVFLALKQLRKLMAVFSIFIFFIKK